ncbi:helix-turn-helix transcriptional regulator [Vibrio fluvialis]
MNIDKSILASNIEKRMNDLGIHTNTDLAKLSGVSRAVITNIKLHPEKTIRLDSGVLLARALKCRVEWLATGEGPINLDDVEKHQRLKYGAPLVKLEELASKEPEQLLMEAMAQEQRERYPCPAGNSESTLVIRLANQIGKFAAGSFIYFDCTKPPASGSVILVQTAKDAAPEIMEYTRAHNREFFKSLSEDLPPELRFIEKSEDMKVLATFAAWCMF